MCGSMVDIQSATAEIRRGKKIERRRKIPQGKNIMSTSATQGGHKNAVPTRRVPDVKFHSVHIGKSYVNPITKTKPNPNHNNNLSPIP